MENRPPPNIRPARGTDRVVVVVAAGLAVAGSSIIRVPGEVGIWFKLG